MRLQVQHYGDQHCFAERKTGFVAEVSLLSSRLQVMLLPVEMWQDLQVGSPPVTPFAAEATSTTSVGSIAILSSFVKGQAALVT
jgi:hypothetical protein